MAYFAVGLRGEAQEQLKGLLWPQDSQSVPELEGSTGVQQGGAELERLRRDVLNLHLLAAKVPGSYVAKVNGGGLSLSEDETGTYGGCCEVKV